MTSPPERELWATYTCSFKHNRSKNISSGKFDAGSEPPFQFDLGLESIFCCLNRDPISISHFVADPGRRFSKSEIGNAFQFDEDRIQYFKEN